MKVELASRTESVKGLEGRREDSLGRERDFLSQIEIKDKEIEARVREVERLRYSLDRYQGGEVYREMEAKVNECNRHIAELETHLAAKNKELEDFKTYLSERQAQADEKAREQTERTAGQVKELEDQLRIKTAKAEELEAEIGGFRRLLRQADVHSRSLQEEVGQLGRDRELLLRRFKALGHELTDYQSRITRHFGEIVPEKSASPLLPEAKSLHSGTAGFVTEALEALEADWMSGIAAEDLFDAGSVTPSEHLGEEESPF